MELVSKLKAFRQEAYSYLGRAKDATFELMDAIMLTRKADSLADLYTYEIVLGHIGRR